MGPLVFEIASPQSGDGTDPGPVVGQGLQQSPITHAHAMGDVDRAEQVTGLLDGKAVSLAIRGAVLSAADRLEGIEGSGMTDDQGVEEVSEGGQGLVFGCAVSRNS